MVFDDSPLARYLREAGVEPAPSSVSAVSEASADDVSGKRAAGEEGGREARFRALYGRLGGAEDEWSRLPDVAGARDGRDMSNARRTWGGAVLAISGAVLAGAAVHWGLAIALAVLAAAAMWHVWRRPDETRLEELVHTQEALAKLASVGRKSLNLIREVSLVARGYRLGSRLQRVAPEERSDRFCSILQRACKIAARELVSIVSPALERVSTASQTNACLGHDVNVLLRHCRGLSDQSMPLADEVSVSLGVAAAFLFISLRAAFAFPSLESMLLNDLARIRTACVIHSNNLRLCLKVDWREDDSNDGSEPSSEKKSVSKCSGPPPDADLVRSVLRTVGAKLVLMEEHRQAGHDVGAKEVRQSIADDLERACIDLRSVADMEALREAASRDDAASSGANLASADAFTTETSHIGGLDVDIIGTDTSVQVAQGALKAKNLEDVLEVYLSKGRSADDNDEDAAPQKPRIPRAQRIEEMKRRKIEEEARRSEARSIHTLMGELEGVLRQRKS